MALSQGLIIVLIVFICLIFLITASGVGYYYYNKKKSTSSSPAPSYSPTPSYSPFSSSYEKKVQEALASTATPADNPYLLAKTEFLKYKNNTTDRTKWAFQANSAASAIYLYKQKNPSNTGTNEYKEIIGYETELNTLKNERNNTLTTAQCPAGYYTDDKFCNNTYGPNSSGTMKNEAGCKADPKCKLVGNVIMGGKLCLSCTEPKLTSGLYKIL